MIKFLLALWMLVHVAAFGQTTTPPAWPSINRPTNEINFGSGRSATWLVYWCDNYWGCGNTFQSSYINFNQNTGGGYNNYAYTYVRWPGTDNGQSKTIWFRIGYDDDHHLNANGQYVTSGPCCGFHYGAFTAKPGEIVKLEFWSNNYGGGPYIGQVAWDPQGDGSYELVGGGEVGTQSTVDGGGSYWFGSDITSTQTSIVSSARTRRDGVVLGNRTDIETKPGSLNNNVTVEQIGNYNRIQGLSGGYAVIDGNTNVVNIKQGDTLGKNLIEFALYGHNNNITIWQARNTTTGLQDGTESGGHYAALGVNGDSNTLSIRQGNEGAVNSGHVGLLYVKGDSNNISLRQSANNDKKAFISVDGNNNYGLVSQLGTGNHYIDLSLTGNGHNVNATQKDSGTHKATINLQNFGGASLLTLTQQGSTGQQYSILQQCANLNGCTVSVTQGTGP